MKELDSLPGATDLAPELLQEYHALFARHGIPLWFEGKDRGDVADPDDENRVAERLLMVSTHGYWGDPPPAGVPDTGGQTYYVLEVSKAWARAGRQVIILARWFEPYPRVVEFAEGVWLVRIRAGSDEFVRKEEIYGLTPALAEGATAVASLFGAQGVAGHYADGMVVAAEVAERLEIPLVCVPHSLGVLKMLRLGMDPDDQAELRDPRFHFWVRESFELAGLRAANFEIANTPTEPEGLEEHYGLSFPFEVMPAGAAHPFFEVTQTAPDLLRELGLEQGRFVAFWGRMSTAKNVEGVVAVLGEARRLDPVAAGSVKALLIGGSPDQPSSEERVVAAAVQREMDRYGLTDEDVVRLESQGHATLARIARSALAYVGMQQLEPFGMGIAEAMAAGLPALVSAKAGITRWLDDGEHALFIDPDAPADGAAALVRLLHASTLRRLLSDNGRAKARQDFSWDGIARKQGRVMDRLVLGEDPREGAVERPAETVHFARRSGRAYHRTIPTWRGDFPRITPVLVDAAEELLPHIQRRIERALDGGERLVVALGGESGSGKTEISHLLTLMLRHEGIGSKVLPGDAFFIRRPADNYEHRRSADREGRLAEVIGPQEVDLPRLDRILDEIRKRDVGLTRVPSYSRTRIVPDRFYPDVPVALYQVDAVFIDLTYSLLLENVTCKVYLERSSLAHLDNVKARNLKRDPDQDFDFIHRVLQIEQGLIAPLARRADIVVGPDYRLVER